MLDPDTVIAHATIPGFMRKIPHKWHLDDITRFGDKVGRAAEAMQLSYLTTVDGSLGTIRVFPMPLLQRIYEIMAPQFNWPTIIEGEMAQIEDGRRAQREELRKSEQLSLQIEELMSHTDDPPVVEAASVLIASLGATIAQARAALGGQRTAA